MNRKNHNKYHPSRLPVSLLNNRLLVKLINIVLILLIILLVIQILPIFQPFINVINLFALPIIGAGILSFVFSPLVNRLDQQGYSRRLVIFFIFFIIILLFVWGGYTLIPILREQTASFIENLPTYYDQIANYLTNLPYNLDEILFNETFRAMLSSFDWQTIADNSRQVISNTFGGLGNVLGSLTQFLVGLITLPVILYYLLLDGHKLPDFILYHVPDKFRHSVARIMSEVNLQISRFIRGTIFVAILVGFMFWTGYKIIGLEYAFLLAFLAAIFNVIPYLGSIFSVIPALLIAIVTSPYMLLKVIIVLAVEQFIESRILQPYILGTSLSIHPVTILLVILAAGRVFGVKGVLLAVPTYAVLKVIFKEIYQVYRNESGLYQEDVSIKEGQEANDIAEDQ